MRVLIFYPTTERFMNKVSMMDERDTFGKLSLTTVQKCEYSIFRVVIMTG